MMQTIQETTTHPLITGYPPEWANAWGHDEYGIWLTLNYKDVDQKMRWIPPGQFMMGSPKEEAGRYDDETQHPVTLTRGFWLFDTPVTQALWEAVMGNNPGYFKSPDRPVEQVSWEDCRKFLEKLNEEIPGLNLCLPTVAQWEYACRAGTTTATYAGEMKILGENNAPILDEIAWYGGNSGIDFELDNGYDSSDWTEKQYDHKKAGTHSVALKQANPWGLYDMLGNVLEWCDDYWQSELGTAHVADPSGPDQGTGRVLRGGSWFGYARGVRAACRDHGVPGNRDDDLGFRCARVQEA